MPHVAFTSHTGLKDEVGDDGDQRDYTFPIVNF